MSKKAVLNPKKGTKITEKVKVNKNEKPNYGYVALKPFLGVTIIGIVGLIVALAGFFIDWSLSWVLLLIGIPVAFVGLYIGASYIPMHYLLLRPRYHINMWKQIFENEGFKGDEHLLDVGCGTGSTSINWAKLLKKGKVIGIDIYSGMSGNSPDLAYRNAEIEGVIDRVEFKYGNVLEIPYPNNTFDIVTVGSVLHELREEEDKIKALNEIKRVLKPGGKFITVELLRNAKMFLAMLFFAFVWKPKQYWTNLLEKTGFKNLKIEEYKRYINYAMYIAQK
ncbi:MAG: class I SAM-dependent methyltransferase [Candidatus Lokiarchaeia archaeon]